MPFDLLFRQSPRAFMTTLILALMTLLSTGSANAAVLPQTAVAPAAQGQNQSATVPSHDEIRRTLLRQPLYFEPAADGTMTRRSPEGTMRLDAGGKAQFSATGKAAISMLLDGASTTAKPAGEATLPGRTNYLLGNDPARWRTGVRQFSRVRVPAVYPGIDVVYYGNGNQLEHDYLLAANADSSLIRMRFQGATTVKDDSTGDLILRQTTSTGSPNEMLRLLKPVAYQQAEDGPKTPVSVGYRPLADGNYGFTLGAYDHRQAVVIDPVIVYGSYFGGNSNDSIVDLKLASDGSLYLLLTTDSTNLKTVGATTGACVGKCGPANNEAVVGSQPDMYLAKLDSTFQTLLFATYLGGSLSDQAYNLALDTDGSIYIAGGSQSTDFPIVNGYPGGAPTGNSTAGTLTKLSADGSTILYSTFIGFGSPSASFAPPVMVSANNGIVYIIGKSDAGDGGFIWQKNPLFPLAVDFLAKLDTTKTGTDSVVYATCIGDGVDGSKVAQIASLALDSKGDVWLQGQTNDSGFPTTTANALEPACRSTPCVAAFLMEIDPTGSSIPYATFLGGTNGASDTVVAPRDIVIDPSDNIYVSGYTNQGDFPTVNGYELAIDGYYAGYASKVSSDGTTLLYSTFLPVSVEIAVSTKGQMAFTGVAGSGFPVKNNLQTSPLGSNNYDAVFGLIDTTQSFDDSLLVSSYLGTTTGTTLAQRAYLASTGQILIVGGTNATDVPIANAYQSTTGGGPTDGFIAAIQPGTAASLTVTPTSIAFPSTALNATSAAMTATLTNGTDASISFSGALTDGQDFTESDSCNGTIATQASCTLSFTFNPKTASSLSSIYTITPSNNSSGAIAIALTGTGTGPVIVVGPPSLSFGTQTVGVTSLPQNVGVTNNGSVPVPITGASVSGAGFAISANTCGSSVAAGANCAYSITVTPPTFGQLSGTLTITDNVGTQTVQLSATGTTALETLTPAMVNFGNAYDGNTVTQTVTYTNKGNGPADIGSTTITPSVFQIVSTTCPAIVQAGASCTYTLSFTPTAVITTQGSFSVTDGISNPSVALSGTGLQPQNGDVFLIPAAIDFQNIVVNNFNIVDPPTITLNFSNQTSQTIEIDPNGVQMVGAQPQYFSAIPCNHGAGTVTLAPGATCQLYVSFGYNNLPAADMTVTAQLVVNWNYAGQTTLHALYSAVTANTISAAAPVVTPSSIQFAGTSAGATSAAQTVTVTNNGDVGLGFTGVSFNGTNPTAFAQTNNCPATINRYITCQISVTFSPDNTATQFNAGLVVGLSTGNATVSLSGSTSATDFVLSSNTGVQYPGANPTWVLNIVPLTTAGFNQPITFKGDRSRRHVRNSGLHAIHRHSGWRRSQHHFDA